MKINNIQIYIIILILISFISCKENKQLQNVEEGISPLQGNNNVIIKLLVDTIVETFSRGF